MHRALSSRWLRSALSIGDRAALADVPVYLCPSLSAASTRHTFAPADARRKLPYRQRRCVHLETTPAPEPALVPEIAAEQALPQSSPTEPLETLAKRLPTVCSGCGALSQTTEAGQAGYYDLDRKAVRDYISPKQEETEKEARKEDLVVEQALQNLGQEQLEALGLDVRKLRYGEELESDRPTKGPSTQRVPLCDRCHKLVHHHAGEPIFHPSVDSLRETIEESPFKHNHIYHVIDAADFPMSFIPKLHLLLEANLKHRNRRNTSGRYHKDRRFDMDFIITRSDLLAPKKEMVDSMMPYLRDVLRKSLGKYGKLITLGNVRCVSAQRGWWTKNLKDAIYDRGGAGWMVGKVNVGKSQLFEAVFPKGTTAGVSLKNNIEISMFATEDSEESRYLTDDTNIPEPLDVNSLLPPVRAETNYPEMPTVSSLPGTTASPIRIPFGNGRGELIDLPGIARSDLEKYVKPEHRQSLIMKHRIKPEQHTLKPGQSLLLGGLIRITPATEDQVFLAYNFTPIPEHRTSNEKAIEFQEQTRQAPNVDQLAVEGAGEKMKLAGTFQLRHDVTKERAGPLTRKDVGKMKVEDLPWRVLATDILIESVGWVEIVAQVRLRHLMAGVSAYPPPPEPEPVEEDDEDLDGFAKLEKAAKAQAGVREKPKARPKPKEPNWPVVEVYSPEGRFVGERPPMNGWLLNKSPKKDIKKRPRKSMKGAKKAEKQARREAAA
ncbi:hypothetical protein CkaCkLH20_04904 [Colletotrichum karsti]|uniref:Genetic interactor of prohibitins 3 n=1 Tax=Colletotrichum karsti TaxID=1095194 RepID=A0A9P6LIX7_9PEZI|nr:uncharacterized protein CkaCkLH20_04904 [Colletotrichum karsti]KAF9877769.1 hypothetical protein CkaCkLH20_04904 [Colletotrichum karsti]